MAETHAAIVLLAGDRAYKIKKPVSFGFLDFRAREARERACRREVELNRDFAPDVYLGAADVVVDGTPVEHMVVMRRMPAERRLATMLRDGRAGEDELRAVVRAVVSFHERADRSARIDRHGTPVAVRARWQRSFEEMLPFVGTALSAEELGRMRALALDYIAGRRPLFEARLRGGWIRDGHGDLLAEDIFMLDDGPRILDRLEFNDELRYVDTLDDIAFLAMDVERLAGLALARRVIAAYREFSGDLVPRSLADHYIAYRALIRAKVGALRWAQGVGEALTEARRHVEIALAHLAAGRARIVLVGGAPGTGKTSLARGLGDARGWAVLRSDVTRKEMAGLAPTERTGDAYRAGIYRPERTTRTYEMLLHRARALLERGESVVLDATWGDAWARREAAAVAAATRSELTALRCVAPDPVRDERIAAREGDASDAGRAIAQRVSESFDPWPEAIEVATTGSPARSLERALVALSRGRTDESRASA